MTPWGTLRPGLLTDLGFDAPASLAAAIGYSDAGEVTRALGGEPVSDDLMSALLRHYLSTPPLYFVRTDSDRSAA